MPSRRAISLNGRSPTIAERDDGPLPRRQARRRAAPSRSRNATVLGGPGLVLRQGAFRHLRRADTVRSRRRALA
mgnify:CR=1 FL=1